MKDKEKTKEELIDELMASHRKITEMEKFLEETKQTENLFERFVDSSPFIMALLEGSPSQTKFLNPLFSRLFGYSVDDIPDIDHWWLRAYPDPAYRKEVMAKENRKYLERSTTQFVFGPVETVVTCKDGSRKNIEFRTVSFGTTYLVYGIDLTERKRADKESKEKEERFNALFNRSFDCVYVHDFEGHFLDANPAALDLLGYKREEISSLSFASLLDKNQLTKALKSVEEIKQAGYQRALMEYQLRCKDGKQVYVETKVSLIYRDQKPYAILGIACDITTRKEAEALLRKREEELKVRTVHLEETNAALNVLIRQREKAKKDFEDEITANIREMVNPYIEKLKATTLDEVQNITTVPTLLK